MKADIDFHKIDRSKQDINNCKTRSMFRLHKRWAWMHDYNLSVCFKWRDDRPWRIDLLRVSVGGCEAIRRLRHSRDCRPAGFGDGARSEAPKCPGKTGIPHRRTALIAGSRAGLLAVGQSFTALIFWFFCIKAKEQKIKNKYRNLS